MAKKSGEPSKAQMVREALGKLGWDKSVADYHAYIVSTHGVDMSKAHISQQVSNERRKQGQAPKRRGRRKGSKNKVKDETVAPVATPASVGIGELLEFVSVLTKWEEKLGTANIREALKHFSKNG